jgi:hypothetical protein
LVTFTISGKQAVLVDPVALCGDCYPGENCSNRGTRLVRVYTLIGTAWKMVLSNDYIMGDIFVSNVPGKFRPEGQELNALVVNLFLGNKECPTRRAPDNSSQAQATSAGGVRARLRRVAGCATPSGSAGHAGETANLKLTFHLDHSAGADHVLITRFGFRAEDFILEEFGVPFYIKVDIQGYDSFCVKDLDSQQLPKFISVSDIDLLDSLYRRGFNYFKCITQKYYLPLQLPLTAEAMRLQRAEWLQQTRNPLMRAFRKLGGRHWMERQFHRIRTRDGWLFPHGSSGPFGDDLLGWWLSYDELSSTYGRFLELRRQSPGSLLWAPGGILSNPFNIDLHACRA